MKEMSSFEACKSTPLGNHKEIQEATFVYRKRMNKSNPNATVLLPPKLNHASLNTILHVEY